MSRQQSMKTARLVALLGTALLAGCNTLSRVNSESGEADGLLPASPRMLASPQRSFSAPADDVAAIPGFAEAEELNNSSLSNSSIAPSRPQLIRRAQMTVVVDSLSESLEQITELLGQHNGELLSLYEFTPSRDGDRHSASLQLRVPQAQLDAAVDDFNTIGTVQSQSITAEDVSTQIVDYDARLRNLRRGEETVLALFERSGRLSDALDVSRELSNIRSQIEQTEAHLSFLQTQVTYSHITLTLETALAAVPRERSLVTRLKDAWQQSTHSLGNLTVGVLEGGIWLVVYSPYWIVIGSGAAVTVVQLKRWYRSRQESVHN